MKVIRLDSRGHGSFDVTEDEVDELDIAIEELRDAKAKLEKIQRLVDYCSERILALMDEREEKTHLSPLSNGWQATAVYGDVVTYDDKAILDALDPTEAEAVTILKVDRKKLEAEVLAGRVDPHLVASHATVKPRKPFIKLTEHREQESEASG